MSCPSGCVPKEGHVLSCKYQFVYYLIAHGSISPSVPPFLVYLWIMFLQVKDTMRLLGVIKSLPAITSRIGVGGAASSWVIKEFIAQIHTVSKVALHRKSNLASFLETHGINCASVCLTKFVLFDYCIFRRDI